MFLKFLKQSTLILRDGEAEGGGGGDSTMFQPGEGGGDNKSGTGGAGGTPDRPDWLVGKFDVVGDDGALDLSASAQKQAEAYSDLYRSFSKKTDALRAEVLQDAVKEYGKTIGVPEDVSEYAYPDGYEPPAENVDATLRDWAKTHNVNNEAFQSLVKDVWGQTQVNHKAEFEKLGTTDEERTSRISAVNKFANANFDQDDFPIIAKVMQTAEGVAFMERLAEKSRDAGWAPDDDGDVGGESELTRENIRKLQGDPRFGTDEAYTNKVRGMWKKFAQLPANKQR